MAVIVLAATSAPSTSEVVASAWAEEAAALEATFARVTRRTRYLSFRPAGAASVPAGDIPTCTRVSDGQAVQALRVSL